MCAAGGGPAGRGNRFSHAPQFSRRLCHGGTFALDILCPFAFFSAVLCVDRLGLAMTAAVVRAFEADKGLIHVIIAGALEEIPLRVSGSDRKVVAHLQRGRHIRFNLTIDHNGFGCAVDVSTI